MSYFRYLKIIGFYIHHVKLDFEMWCRSHKYHPVGFEQRSHKKEMGVNQYFFKTEKILMFMIDSCGQGLIF